MRLIGIYCGSEIVCNLVDLAPPVLRHHVGDKQRAVFKEEILLGVRLIRKDDRLSPPEVSVVPGVVGGGAEEIFECPHQPRIFLRNQRNGLYKVSVRAEFNAPDLYVANRGVVWMVDDIRLRRVHIVAYCKFLSQASSLYGVGTCSQADILEAIAAVAFGCGLRYEAVDIDDRSEERRVGE